MLNEEIITSKLGNSYARRFVSRGLPQGGVLSPLWNLVVNKIPTDLDANDARKGPKHPKTTLTKCPRQTNTLR